jgi:hypothetical protein
MKNNKKQLNIKFLLNTAANEDVSIDSITALPSLEVVEDPFLGLNEIISNIEVEGGWIIGSLAFFGMAAIAKIVEWLRNLPPNCLKYFKDPRMKKIIDELEAFFNLFRQSMSGNNLAGQFYTVLNDPREASSRSLVLFARTIAQILEEMRDLLNIISDGNCNLEFKKFLKLLIEFSPFGGIEDVDVFGNFEKVLDGVLEPGLALGAIFTKFNEQFAAAWATDCVVRQYGCQTTQGPTAGVDWGQVALWTTLGVGAVAIIVFTGGAAAPIALAVTGGAALTCSGAALADMPDSEIQQLIQERIQQQQALLNG